jgi:hypothetical protein
MVLPLLRCVVLHPQLHIEIRIESKAAAAACTRPHMTTLYQMITPKHQPLDSHAGQ